MKKILQLVFVIAITLALLPMNSVKAEGHSVTVDDTIKNARITTTNNVYEAGNKVYGNYKVNDGYYISDIYFNGESITLDNSGGFSFTMPDDDVIITANVQQRYTKFEDAIGIFGPEWSRKLNTLAKMFGMSGRDLEKKLDEWTKATYSPKKEVVVTTEDGGTDDFITNTIINVLVLDYEQNYGPTSPTAQQAGTKTIDVKKCFLNSDIFWKGLAKTLSAINASNSVALHQGLIKSFEFMYSGSFASEIERCEGAATATEVCPVTELRKQLNEARSNPGAASSKSNFEILKEKVKGILDLVGVSKTSEELDVIINEALEVLNEKGDGYIEYIMSEIKSKGIGVVEEHFGELVVLFSIPIYNMGLQNVLTLSYYLTDELLPIDFYEVYLNSDVTYKGQAKFIDALQTKNVMTILATILSLYPKIKDEDIKLYTNTYGEEYIKDYIKFLISKSFTKHSITNVSPKEAGLSNGGYIEIIDKKINNIKDEAMNTDLVKLRVVAGDSYNIGGAFYIDSKGYHYLNVDSNGKTQFIMPNEDVTIGAILSKKPDPKDESCEKVIGPTWHWNNAKGVCEEVGVVGTYTR